MDRYLACLEAGSARSALLSGGLFGLAAIVRPNALVVVPGLALLLAARAGARRRGAALAFAAATLVFPLAATAVNWIRGGDLVFIASQSGVNLYIGNNRTSNGWSAVAPGLRPDWWGGYQDMIRIPEREEGRALKPSEVSAYWTRRAIREIAEDPVWWLGHMARKTYLWFGAEELSNNKDLAFWKTRFPVIRWLPVHYGVLAPLAILGALLVPWRLASPLVLFVLPYAASFVLFFVTSRYRLTTVPFLAILAAGALDRLAGFARHAEWRPFAAWTAALVALTALLSAGLAPVAQPTFALSYMEIGRREMERQRWGAAEAAFRKALDYEPGSLDARHDLGIALREGGRPDSALAHLTAVAEARGDARTWNNVGLTLWALARRGEAREAFRSATAREPRDADAWLNLAVLTEEEGDWAAALELLERGAALRGEDAMVWYHRAFILSRLGRIREARAAVAACLRLAPDLGDARTLSSLLESAEPDTADPGKQPSVPDTMAARPGR
jgi:tetratricopeptide (TPR) repeat protein